MHLDIADCGGFCEKTSCGTDYSNIVTICCPIFGQGLIALSIRIEDWAIISSDNANVQGSVSFLGIESKTYLE